VTTPGDTWRIWSKGGGAPEESPPSEDPAKADVGQAIAEYNKEMEGECQVGGERPSF